MSLGIIVIVSIFSSLLRSFLNIIDRYQIGIKDNSVSKVNYFNNLFTIIVTTIIVICMNKPFDVLHNVFSYQVIIYAAIVQIVAYGYSYLFKLLKISQSIIVSNTADVFIPIGMFLTTGYFSGKSYLLSIFTTLICFIVFFSEKNNLKKMIRGSLVIIPLLTIQAALSPLLLKNHISFQSLLIFTIATLYIRFIITQLDFFFRKSTSNHQIDFKLNKKELMLYSLRSFITIGTQFTFVVATSSIYSSIAWVFLNLSSIFAVLFSGWILKEQGTRREVIIIIAITIATILRLRI